jgi:hypothetical protein
VKIIRIANQYDKYRNNPKVIWHASNAQFDHFLLKEIGFHFAANPELAMNAAELGGKSNAQAIPYELLTNRIVEITAQKNGFNGETLVEDLLNRNIITEDQFGEVIDAYELHDENPDDLEDQVYRELEENKFYQKYDMYKQTEAKLLLPFFKKWGIDGFKFWNTFDAYGMASAFLRDGETMESEIQPDWSYIILENNNIKRLI